MKKGILLTVSALVLGGAIAVGVVSTQASATAEEQVTQAATTYIEAVKNGDAETAVRYVQDVRYQTEEEAIAGYKETMRSDPVTDAKLLNVEMLGSKKAEVTIEYATDFAGTQQVVFPVQEMKDGSWKVVIDNVPKVKRNK